MVNRLSVSFWDLCLDSLPQGWFERRVLGAGDASQMIRAARIEACCVSARTICSVGCAGNDRVLQYPGRFGNGSHFGWLTGIDCNAVAIETVTSRFLPWHDHMEMER